MKLSARNLLKGTIVEVKKGQTTAYVRIDVAGTVVTASINNERRSLRWSRKRRSFADPRDIDCDRRAERRRGLYRDFCWPCGALFSLPVKSLGPVGQSLLMAGTPLNAVASWFPRADEKTLRALSVALRVATAASSASRPLSLSLCRRPPLSGIGPG